MVYTSYYNKGYYYNFRTFNIDYAVLLHYCITLTCPVEIFTVRTETYLVNPYRTNVENRVSS